MDFHPTLNCPEYQFLDHSSFATVASSWQNSLCVDVMKSTLEFQSVISLPEAKYLLRSWFSYNYSWNVRWHLAITDQLGGLRSVTGGTGELSSVLCHVTSISSSTPRGSSVSGASGPPGFAATAITGQSLNLDDKRKKRDFFISWAALTERTTKWAEWVTEEMDNRLKAEFSPVENTANT